MRRNTSNIKLFRSKVGPSSNSCHSIIQPIMAHQGKETMDTESHSFIKSLADKCIDSGEKDTWYCVAVGCACALPSMSLALIGQACAFAAANQGQYVGDVYRQAISAYREDDYAQHRRILRRIKESILKTGIIYGIPRVINAFRALIQSLPDPNASNEIESTRLQIKEPASLDQRGIEYMRNIFRADMVSFSYSSRRESPS
jgi:hypothetical protein